MITPSEPLKQPASRNDNDKKNPTSGEFYYDEEEVEEEHDNKSPVKNVDNQ